MAFNLTRILKSLLLREENTLTPKELEIVPGGSASTKTTFTASQTANRTITLPDITDTLVSRTNTESLTNKQISYTSTDDSAATGNNATLNSITTGVVRLTNGSLNSVGGIPSGATGKILIVENKTGKSVTVNNEDSNVATATNRILTGTGGGFSLANNASMHLVYDSSSSRWQVVGGTGSGSGSGAKNYLSAVITSQSPNPNPGNGNFEFGNTSGWSLGTIGTLTNSLPTGTPTFNSGAAGTLSISAVSTNQLAGNYSLSYASSAVGGTTQGNMLASDAFYIDSSDQARVLTWSFTYKAQTSPSTANWSGTNSNSFGVAAWDVSNNEWLPNTGNFSMTQSSGAGRASGTFQTKTNTAQIRLVVYNANATTGPETVYFDDFYVGPQTVAFGTPITDPVAYTPTISAGFGTCSNVNFFSWRKGKNLCISGSFTAGTVANTQANFTIGFNGGNQNVKIDSSIIPTSPNRVVGYWGTPNTLTSFGYMVTNTTGSQVLVYFTQAAGSKNSTEITNASIMGGNNGIYTVYLEVPIEGWSSSVQMLSNDTDTRVVVASASTTSSSPTANNPIIFNTLAFDTHGSFNTSTGRYTVPVTGYYRVGGNVQTASNSNTSYSIFKNGSSHAFIGTADSGNGDFTWCSLIQANAGEILDIRPTSGGITTDGVSSVQFERVTGPAVIAASETVAASYSTTAAQSIPTGASTAVVFGTKEFDSHNAMNAATGAYTVPVAGKYLVTVAVKFAIAGAVVGEFSARIGLNGADQASSGFNMWTGVSVAHPVTVTKVINCVAGDVITGRAFQNSGSANALTSAAIENYISINRVGN